MRVLKTILVTLLMGIIVSLSFSCSGNGQATDLPTTRTATAVLGNISLTVTGTGTLALSQTESLAFDIAGTVDEILVDESESVTKGQELVKLDTSDLEDQISSLEKKLDTAQRDLAAKESSLTRAQRQISVKELSLRQAELDVQSVENSLSNIGEVNAAQAKVERAELDLKTAQSSRDAAALAVKSDELAFWTTQINDYYIPTLARAKAELREVLEGTSINISGDVALQIKKAQLQLEQSKMSFEDAKIAISDAHTAVDNAVADKADAARAVTDAQNDLEEAKNLSLVITAPFDGFITKINVKGGDTVQKGTVALQLADPNKFEANIMVTEMDIFSVKVGGDAVVSLDALSDYAFPAKITAVAPSATSSQGVVNYKVTAELTSLTPLGFYGTSKISNQPNTGGSMPTNFPGGKITAFPGGARPTALPSGFPTALPEGVTPTNVPGGVRPTNFPSRALPTSLPGNGETASGITSGGANAIFSISLKDGLTATVTITIQQKNNVLVVPSRAITKQNGSSMVQVVKDTVTETRVVKTGLSDGSNIEITEGLSEGEQVLVKTSSSSSSSSNVLGPGKGVMQGIRVP